jgi:hypothetical protein
LVLRAGELHRLAPSLLILTYHLEIEQAASALSKVAGIKEGVAKKLCCKRKRRQRLASLARAKAGPRAVGLSDAAVAILPDLHSRLVLG